MQFNKVCTTNIRFMRLLYHIIRVVCYTKGRKNLKSCCFTGHRNIKPDHELENRLREVLTYLIEKGVTDFYAGAASGFDALCERTVIALKQTYSSIKLHLILPCPKEYQTQKWNKEQIAEYEKILGLADSVNIISDRYTPDCMKKRNEHLVKVSDCCVCYYNSRRYRSGTGQTVRMAERKGIEIINLYKPTG